MILLYRRELWDAKPRVNLVLCSNSYWSPLPTLAVWILGHWLYTFRRMELEGWDSAPPEAGCGNSGPTSGDRTPLGLSESCEEQTTIHRLSHPVWASPLKAFLISFITLCPFTFEGRIFGGYVANTLDRQYDCSPSLPAWLIYYHLEDRSQGASVKDVSRQA